MIGKKAQIKVLIIGKDGYARKHWVDHDAQFFDNKYKIDYDAVYQTLDGGIFGYGAKQVPTIMFRENNVLAISHRVKPSQPDPDEMGSSISRAAWAIAELMRKKNEQVMQYLMILMVIACALSAAGAYFGMKNAEKIDKLAEKMNTIQPQTPDISDSDIPNSLPTPTIPTPAKTPTPKPTQPKPSGGIVIK